MKKHLSILFLFLSIAFSFAQITIAQGGASTSTNTDGITGSGSNATINQYTAKGIKIEWKENSAGQFAYDTQEKTKLPTNKYPSVKDSENNTVYVPYKATVNKKTELFDAKVSITDPTLKDATIIFKTLSIGKAIEATEINKTDRERNYQLKLIGSFDYAEEEVIAVLMPKDSTSKQKVISSFRLVHVSPKTVNVSLVPLDASSQSKLQSQGDELNQIYKKIGVQFNVKKESVLDINSVVNGDTINSEDADLMSTYSPQQQQINALYKGTDARYVLFVTDKKSSTGQKGYMRLNGQFGYVYNNAQDKTGAHELGHGVFKLEHPWKAYGTTQSATPLLMDYSTGEELSHLDWKQINDPAFKLYAFQGQSSGEDRNSDGIDLLGNIIEKVVFNETDKTLIGTLSNNQNEKYLRVGYELYSNADKKLLASYPAKLINNKVVYQGMPYNVITRSSGRAKINLLADKCYYSTTYINWEKPVNVTASEIITLIVEKTKNSVWENNSLFNPDPSCSVYNSWADIKANDQSCTADKIKTEIPILKSLLEKNIDADTASKTVNQYCLGTLRNLTYETILKYIKLIAGQKSLFKANVADDSEIAILRLISAISSSDYPKFFNELESTNNELINNLITELDDHSVFFWDGNNYTNFIGTLLHIYTVYPDAWSNKVGIEQTPDYFVDRYLTRPKLQIKDIGELIQGGSEIYWQSFVYDDNSGNIILEQNKGNIQAIGGAGNTVLYSMIGAPSIIKTTTVSPLSPVIIDYNNDVDAVKILLENSGYKEGDVVIIPAIFLKYGLDKIEDRAKEKSTLLALNTVTIATGMPVILQGATFAKRVWAAAEVAGALGDITVNNQYIENKYPELKQTINAYNGVMGLIAVKNLVTSKGTKNLYSAAHSTVKTAFQNRNEFKSIIAAKYLDWNGFTMKFKSPEAYINAEVRKTLEEQESVLGLLSGKVLRKFNNADEIAQYLKTDKDGAYFWSGRMSNNQGVMDIALDIAQSKGGNTLEGMLAKYNIEMPIWDGNNPASVKAWEDVSALYATQVSGEVNAVLGKSLRPGNIWETVELPRLKTNTNVTKISTIDPETMKVTIIFENSIFNVLDSGLISELKLAGVKFNENELKWLFKNNGGKIIFLEKGNASAGFEHILSHKSDFIAKGIAESDISDFIMQALKENKIVGYQGSGVGRPIYELVYKGTKQKVAITTGSNGFVVGANPTLL